MRDLRGTVALVCPTAPMPKLRKFHLAVGFSGPNNEWARIRINNSNDFISWVMDNAATTFPNIQELDLSIDRSSFYYESINMPLTTNHSVKMAAAGMNRRVRKLLLSSPNMKLFRMSEMRSQEPSLLDEGFANGAIGLSLSEELNVRSEAFGRVKWQREVEFEIDFKPLTYTNTLYLDVIYKYTLKGE